MNKQIKRIASEAGFDSELMERNHNNGVPSIAEVFSTLILKECIANLKDSHDNEYGLTEAIERLKQYFEIN